MTRRDLTPLGLGRTAVDLEDRPKLRSKLLAHEAVQDEVNGGVNEGQDVPNFRKGVVALPEEFLTVETRQEGHDPLGEFRN